LTRNRDACRWEVGFPKLRQHDADRYSNRTLKHPRVTSRRIRNVHRRHGVVFVIFLASIRAPECRRRPFAATGITSCTLLRKMTAEPMSTTGPVLVGWIVTPSDGLISRRESSGRRLTPCQENTREPSPRESAQPYARSLLLPALATISESRRHGSRFPVCLPHVCPGCDADMPG
jgi:hypothetical protein